MTSAQEDPAPPPAGETTSERETRRRLQWRLNTNETLTLVVSVASLVVAAGSFLSAADTREMKTAVGNLGSLAQETKRSADAMNKQIAYLQAQVGEAKEQTKAISAQVIEAKEQTKAISAQTEAIRASADANIRSSEANIRSSEANIRSALAQKRMADLTAKAQEPGVDLKELAVTELMQPPNAEGNVPFKAMWEFRNTGGSAFKAKKVVYGFWVGDSLPERFPAGTTVAGNDYVITNSITSALKLREPATLFMPAAARDAVTSGRKQLFFYAKFEYADNNGDVYIKCFGAVLPIRDGQSVGYAPAGGPAYRCGN